MEAPPRVERAHIDKLCTSIRGKLQFMDYLVRAAVADVERFQAESDPGTKIFLRQLIEMHANNLSQESDSMKVIGDLCNQLSSALGNLPPSISSRIAASAPSTSPSVGASR